MSSIHNYSEEKDQRHVLLSDRDTYSTPPTTSLNDFGNDIGTLADNSMAEIKNRVGEAVQGMTDRVYSVAMGSKEAEESTGVDDWGPGPQEAGDIDNIPNETVAEFLREKHKSNAQPSGKHA